MKFVMYAIRSKTTGKWFCGKQPSEAFGHRTEWQDSHNWGETPSYIRNKRSADAFVTNLRKFHQVKETCVTNGWNVREDYDPEIVEVVCEIP